MAPTRVRRTIVVNLGEMIPPSALCMLAVPPVPPEAVSGLEAREGARVTVGAPDSAEAEAAGPFDCIFFHEPGVAGEYAACCAGLLDTHGMLALPVGILEDGRPAEDTAGEAALCEAGFRAYVAYENSIAPEAGCRLVSGGRVFRRIMAWVKNCYDPFAHAERLREAGRPDWAFEVLKLAPLGLIGDVRKLAAATLIKQLYLEEQFDDAGAARRLELLWKAQEETYYLPNTAFEFLGETYGRQARMWRKIGVQSHGAKMMRDLRAACVDHPAHFEALEPHPCAAQPQPEFALPEWQTPEIAPRVLMLTPLFPNYGLDVLYDGLCDALGDGNVDEYPWKPWLHGDTPDIAENYPCTANRQGRALDNRELVTRVYEGYYDYVLIPDVESSIQFLHPTIVQVVVKAARNTPVFVIDQADDFLDHRNFLRKEIDFSRVCGYFKRELLAGVDYGAGIYPCPFSYQQWRAPRQVEGHRGQDVFWAGARNSFRAVYLEQIERRLGKRFDRKYTQAEYRDALLDSRIGISLGGAGFDTVRYWELPAHGCMMLSERLPTVIPHDFEDGVSAVFADDASDLAEKLDYYVRNPEQADRIAKAGRAHFLKYHTASARARQLLARMKALT